MNQMMVERDDKPGEYRWGMAWATVALLAFAVVLLFVPHARWFGAAILAGYWLLVDFALNRSIWGDRRVKRDE